MFFCEGWITRGLGYVHLTPPRETDLRNTDHLTAATEEEVIDVVRDVMLDLRTGVTGNTDMGRTILKERSIVPRRLSMKDMAGFLTNLATGYPILSKNPNLLRSRKKD